MESHFRTIYDSLQLPVPLTGTIACSDLTSFHVHFSWRTFCVPMLSLLDFPSIPLLNHSVKSHSARPMAMEGRCSSPEQADWDGAEWEVYPMCPERWWDIGIGTCEWWRRHPPKTVVSLHESKNRPANEVAIEWRRALKCLSLRNWERPWCGKNLLCSLEQF